MQNTPVLCVVGPTASGKTALAIALAETLGGEIINMDSMQVYRRMDIGTAKPTLAERKGIPHHLLDMAEPDEPFTVAAYAQAAVDTAGEVFSRGRLPILTGGTGFYLRALTDGLSLGGVPSDPALRAALKAQADTPEGRRALHERLAGIDPETAARLHENDVQRVSRAVEVFELTGLPFSQQPKATPNTGLTFCMLGTTLERSLLYARINERVETMMDKGLLSEVEGLLRSGVPLAAQAMQGIGYKELAPVITRRAPLAEAVAAIQQNTRHYAKRQWTWFRAEPRVQWLDMSQQNSMQQALSIGEAFWKEAKP